MLAKPAGVGPNRLDAEFRRALGASVAAYVRDRRLARAADLLITSAWDIDRIAEEAGFPNRHYLSRVFARRMGLYDDEGVPVAEVRTLSVASPFDFPRQAALYLPTHLPDGCDAEELVALFARDKKAVDGVTFVLDGPDGVEPVTGIDRDALLDALERIR